jgi:hypothetical protein
MTALDVVPVPENVPQVQLKAQSRNGLLFIHPFAKSAGPALKYARKQLFLTHKAIVVLLQKAARRRLERLR